MISRSAAAQSGYLWQCSCIYSFNHVGHNAVEEGSAVLTADVHGHAV